MSSSGTISIDGQTLSLLPYDNYHGDIDISVTVDDGELRNQLWLAVDKLCPHQLSIDMVVSI